MDVGNHWEVGGAEAIRESGEPTLFLEEKHLSEILQC